MVHIYDLEGKKTKTMELPEVFNMDVRPDLIKRAAVALQSHRLQGYGPNWFSGKDTSAFSFGPGRGLSRIPRVTGGGPARGRGAIVPHAVGGRRAHPPVPERNLKKKINKKEKALATASAIASTAVKELAVTRGHSVKDLSELPLVVVDDLESLDKTKKVREFLSKLGLDAEISRTGTKKTRGGKGALRGRKYKKRKSVLLVVSKVDKIKKAAENINGVEAVSAKDVNVEQLAPGAVPGRLTIYTSSALNDLDERFRGVV